MGNQLCCQEQPKKQFEHHTIPTVVQKYEEEQIKIPQLHPVVAAHLQQFRPFEDKFQQKPTVKQFGNDVYAGEVNEKGVPNGYGKMYHKNGSVFIGEFFQGKADGQGHFVKTDGSYYHGKLSNNKANDQNGFYKSTSPSFEYKGSIVDNQFDGQGRERGDNYEFQGTYEKGQKVNGILKWTEGNKKFEYEGGFNDEGNFQGKGRLAQQGKGEYNGDFENGNKHGFGEYISEDGMKYKGEYYHGSKEGNGIVYNKDGKVAYDGQFKNNMPHGKGKAPNEQGQMKERNWVQGIDKTAIQE